MSPAKYPLTSYEVIISSSLALILVFVAAKFGQYLFIEWETSPAILWPVSGIVLALFWLRGYYLAIPIFVALFLSSYTSPAGYSFPMVFTTPLSQVLAGMLGVYFLRRNAFNDDFDTVRSVLVFLSVIVLVSMVGPTITSSITYFFGTLTVPFYYSWLRTWAGYVFSILILFPVIVSWAKKEVLATYNNRSLLETCALGCLLTVSAYALFWLRLANEPLFLFFSTLFIGGFWACLRFSNRIVTLSIFGIAVFGIFGLFVVPDTTPNFATRLLASELFFLIAVPIFYTFSALVQETNKALRTLAETKDKIEKESMTKSEFMAVLAHELRNPLAPLKSTLEILEFEDISADTKKLVSSAKQQVHTMRRLLEDLLDTTRMMQGKFQLRIARANLCEMLRHCIEYTSSLYEEKNITIVMKQICDDTLWLDVDPVRFEQVIVNILNNAAKYTDHGGRVSLYYEVHEDIVKIIISDTGIGIIPEHLEHIFDSFWQADKMLSRTAGGIGVGLSLTKQIVEMHGGTITAESPGLGQGTTFTVILPVSKVPGGSFVAAKTPAATVLPMSVLVADDNKAAADSLAKLLKLKGHTVAVAYSGLETLERVDMQTHTIVLLDIGLPDLDGYAVAKQLRAKGYTGKLVALSGYSQKEDVEKAYASGFDHYLTKPISVSNLENYFRTLA